MPTIGQTPGDVKGKMLLRAKNMLHFSAEGLADLECECRISAALLSTGEIHIECLVHCGLADLNRLFGAMNLTINGEYYSAPFSVYGVVFTGQQFESTSGWNLMTGEADGISFTMDEASRAGSSRFFLMSPHVGLRASAVRQAFPQGISFSWESMDLNDPATPGLLSVLHPGSGYGVANPPDFVDAIQTLLSLATMTTVHIVGVQNSDGRCEFRATPPMHSRHGFQLIPNFSRSLRREELVFFLSDLAPRVMALAQDKRAALWRAVLYLVESDYEGYLEFRYLKAYFALITIVRAFANPEAIIPELQELECRNRLIEEVQSSQLSDRSKSLIVSRLRGLFELNDRDAIDDLLADLGLEELLPRQLTNQIRGSLLHSAVFQGTSLEEKAARCMEIAFGVSWVLLRLLGYDGVFIHSYRNDFHTEISVQTGMETDT